MEHEKYCPSWDDSCDDRATEVAETVATVCGALAFACLIVLLIAWATV